MFCRLASWQERFPLLMEAFQHPSFFGSSPSKLSSCSLCPDETYNQLLPWFEGKHLGKRDGSLLAPQFLWILTLLHEFLLVLLVMHILLPWFWNTTTYWWQCLNQSGPQNSKKSFMLLICAFWVLFAPIEHVFQNLFIGDVAELLKVVSDPNDCRLLK